MKTIQQLLKDYGYRRMARELGVEPSSVMRWANANKVPRWWKPRVQEFLGVKRFLDDDGTERFRT